MLGGLESSVTGRDGLVDVADGQGGERQGSPGVGRPPRVPGDAGRESGTRRRGRDHVPRRQPVRSRAADVNARLRAATGRGSRSVTRRRGRSRATTTSGRSRHRAPRGRRRARTGTTDRASRSARCRSAMMAPGTFQDVAPVTILTTPGAGRPWPRTTPGVTGTRPVPLEPPARRSTGARWWRTVGRAGGSPSATPCSRSRAAPRCVMTTFPQLGLPRDRGSSRPSRHHTVEFAGFGRWACLGVYPRS